MAAGIAIVFVSLLALLAVFQLLLAAGLPFGHFAWGGQNRVLPRRLRIGSALSIVAYVIFAFIAFERSGITNVIPAHLVSVIAMWLVAGYLILSVLPNLVSKSPQEKKVMIPVSISLAVLATLIAVS